MFNLKNAFLYMVIAGSNNLLYCMPLKRIQGDEAAFKILLLSAIKFAETSSGPTTGPSFDSLVRPNRKFIAKMDSFGLDRLWTFETKEDADDLQLSVHNGGGMRIEWYYVDPDYHS